MYDVTDVLEKGFLWKDMRGIKIVITGTVAYLMGDGPKLSIFSSHRGFVTTVQKIQRMMLASVEISDRMRQLSH